MKNVKKLKVNPKIIALALAGVISATSLTACGNYTMLDTKYDFNKAIIFSGDHATIIEIDKWSDYDGEQIQIQTKDGMFIITSSFDTKLIDDKNSDIKAEDLIKAMLGEDAVISYLDDTVKTNKK